METAMKGKFRRLVEWQEGWLGSEKHRRVVRRMVGW